MEENNRRLNEKNRPIEKPYIIIIFPLSYVFKHGFIVERDVFLLF